MHKAHRVTVQLDFDVDNALEIAERMPSRHPTYRRRHDLTLGFYALITGFICHEWDRAGYVWSLGAAHSGHLAYVMASLYYLRFEVRRYVR